MSPVLVSSSSSTLARPKSLTQTTPSVSSKQVRRLDVAMEDAAGVGVGQGRGDLPADVRHAAVERPVPRFDRRELGPARHHGRGVAGGRGDRSGRRRAARAGRWARRRRGSTVGSCSNRPVKQRLGHAGLRADPARARIARPVLLAAVRAVAAPHEANGPAASGARG